MSIRNFLICLVASSAFGRAATTIVYGPSLYFSERDSPFYGGIVDNAGEGIWLEDFEDQELNTPYVKQEETPGRRGATYRTSFPNSGSSSIRGVDGDDGVIDGQTRDGDVWISLSTIGGGFSNRMRFEFEPNESGDYPRYVGLVITRANNSFARMEVGWDDPERETIHFDEHVAARWVPPGGADPGSPLLQRFVGLYHEEGISRIRMSNVNQIDHLQYGYSIPEPSVSLLSAIAVGFLAFFRMRI